MTELIMKLMLSMSLTCPPAQPTDPAVAKALAGQSGLVRSVAWVESHWRRGAVSKAGAIGLMQIMPRTGKWLAKLCGGPPTVSLADPATSVRLGKCYLDYLKVRTGSELEALIWYNGGHRQWQRYRKGKVLVRETARYVAKVYWTQLRCAP